MGLFRRRGRHRDTPRETPRPRPSNSSYDAVPGFNPLTDPATFMETYSLPAVDSSPPPACDPSPPAAYDPGPASSVDSSPGDCGGGGF